MEKEESEVIHIRISATGKGYLNRLAKEHGMSVTAFVNLCIGNEARRLVEDDAKEWALKEVCYLYDGEMAYLNKLKDGTSTVRVSVIEDKKALYTFRENFDEDTGNLTLGREEYDAFFRKKFRQLWGSTGFPYIPENPLPETEE